MKKDNWNTTDMRVLEFFARREECLPFSVVECRNGYMQAIGEWDGVVFYSRKIKTRLVKKMMRKQR